MSVKASGKSSEKIAGWPIRVLLLADRVRAACSPGSVVLEVQCGHGEVASELSASGFDVLAVDSDMEKIRQAAVRNPGPAYAVHDPLDLAGLISRSGTWANGGVSVVYHHNFLCMFGWDSAVTVLREQAEVAPTVVFMVPTEEFLRQFPEELSGTEWTRPRDEWRAIAEEAGLVVETEDVCGVSYESAIVVARRR